MKKQTLFIILFFLILAGGTYLRFEGLNRQSYWMDEGYTVNAVISGMQNGYERFASILDSGERYYCPVYCFPTRWILGIGYWGLDDATPFRIISAISGLLFVLFSYFFAKRIFNDSRMAMVSMALISFSYYQITWSRQARWYTLTELLMWVGLYLLFDFLFKRGVRNNNTYPLTPSLTHSKTHAKGGGSAILKSTWVKWTKLGFAVLFFILAIVSHQLAVGVLAVALIWTVTEARGEERGARIHPIVIRLTPLTPGPSHAERGDFLKRKHLILVVLFTLGIWAFIEYALGIHILSSQLKNISLHNNLLYYSSFVLRNYWVLICLGIYGFAKSNREIKYKIGLLGVPFILYFTYLSFFYETIEYRYLFYSTPFFFFIASVGLVRMYEDIQKAKKNISQLVVPATFALLIPFLFTSNALIITPQSFYWLEADNPAEIHHRDYYAYTPQPDFNSAYAVIEREIKPGEIVIASHPHFNKIFLNQAGYWLAYDYLGTNKPVPKEQTKEWYVGASVIHDLGELQEIMKTKHGFIVYDLQSTDRRIDPSLIEEIEEKGTLLFFDEKNNYSKIWVYRF